MAEKSTAPVTAPETTDEPTQPTDLLSAIHAFQSQAHSLSLAPDEDGQVGPREYRYLTLGKMMRQAMPLLSSVGLIWATFPIEVDGKPALRYGLSFHKRNRAGEIEAVGGTMMLMLDRDNSQGQGSAITYARRQALSCVLGLVPDDDDDGKAAGDERLIVTRMLTPGEIDATRAAFEKAGADFDEALKTVDAIFDEVDGPVLTLAQGEQLRGLLKLAKGGER